MIWISLIGCLLIYYVQMLREAIVAPNEEEKGEMYEKSAYLCVITNELSEEGKVYLSVTLLHFNKYSKVYIL